MRIKPSMTIHLSRSKFNTGNPSLKANNAHSAKRLILICTTTTAKHAHRSVARSAHQNLAPTIVIKEQLKPTITVLIATEQCTAGKSA